jgi:urea transport system substrate-binding protein
MSLKKNLLLLLVLMVGVVYFQYKVKDRNDSLSTIKVGVLHSLTGTMSREGKSVSDATLFAIDQINKSGGVLGRKIEPILLDGKSESNVFETHAYHLIVKEKVAAIFGCWTSACRKTIKPIVETYNSLLFYPLQYEGLEVSKNIIYTGLTPNQQVLPTLAWMAERYGKRVYIVGSVATLKSPKN